MSSPLLEADLWAFNQKWFSPYFMYHYQMDHMKLPWMWSFATKLLHRSSECLEKTVCKLAKSFKIFFFFLVWYLRVFLEVKSGAGEGWIIGWNKPLQVQTSLLNSFQLKVKPTFGLFMFWGNSVYIYKLYTNPIPLILELLYNKQNHISVNRIVSGGHCTIWLLVTWFTRCIHVNDAKCACTSSPQQPPLVLIF